LKILYTGDSPTVDTGFGIVSKNILKRLHAMGHEITVLGVNHYGEPYDQEVYPYMIYPCDKGQSTEQVFGIHKLWAIQDKLKADIIFFLNDPWIIDSYLKAREGRTYPYTKMVGYYPTDGGPIKPSWMKSLNELDSQVCYSKYAESVVENSNGGKRPSNLHQVYHGVDTEIFRPVSQVESRLKLRLPPDAFIVGMVARNQFRKRFDLLMQAFSEFAKDKPEAKLYLHTAIKDIGFDIQDMSNQFQLKDKLILTEDIQPAHGVPAEVLNIIYNTFDVNCLISLGDGFGLPVAESMATGCPQLVSGHSCLRELVEGHGGLTVKTAAWIMHTQGINTWGGVSDVEDIKMKLEILYRNKELRMRLAKEGYDFIHQEIFSWDYVAKRFDTIFKQLFHILGKEERNGFTTLNSTTGLSSALPMESAEHIELLSQDSLHRHLRTNDSRILERKNILSV
jgi:glycosyltransferase involved in cell wall biosynthesis